MSSQLSKSRYFIPATITTSLFLIFSSSSPCQAFSTSSSSSTPRSSARTKLQRPKPSTPLYMAEPSNPFSSFVSDFASSIMGKSISSSSTNPAIDTQITELLPDQLSSWKLIREDLSSKQSSEEERHFRANLEYGYGPASPLHKIRLYSPNNSKEDVRVTFYRDSASWCPYCQKVWMTLEQKQIPYKIEKVNMRCYGDKPASFLKMQPNGNIPVAEIDGVIYNQSNDILYSLEDLFPNHESLVCSKDSSADERDRFQRMLRLERQLFGAWMYWLTGPAGTGGKRNQEQFIQVLRIVEEELKQVSDKKGFFMGDRVTMVDFMFAPFLERTVASLLFYKGFQIRVSSEEYDTTEFYHVNKWFDAMESLSSYRLTKSDYYTHCWDLPPQLGGCSFEPDSAKPYEEAINGIRNLNGQGGSWEFPLLPHNGGVEPDWSWCNDVNMAQLEAVERLSYNHEAIVAFASRGAGKKGMPPVMAPLSDPNAVSNPNVSISVDAILKIVCHVMLLQESELGVSDERMAMEALLKNIISKWEQDENAFELKKGVVDSLVYLRDRIGVPRDMRLPAARLLRANLNWALGVILDA